MVKKTAVQKKTEDTPVETPPVTTTTTEDSTKKVSKRVSRKSTEPVVAAPATENQVVENVTVVSDASQLTDSFTEFMTKFQSLVTQMSTLKVDFKALEKKAVREIKAAQKEKAKRRRKTGNRSPSGFVKPTLISSELAKFLGKPTGTEMARTEVTREINAYKQPRGYPSCDHTLYNSLTIHSRMRRPGRGAAIATAIANVVGLVGGLLPKLSVEKERAQSGLELR